MHSFVRNLITEWRRLGLPVASETVVAAVSGGADSVSLLLAIDDLRRRKKLELHLIAVHFNHNLRGAESEADEEFVCDLASKFDIEFVCGKGKVSKKGNLEQNARNVRYDFLQKIANKTNAFAVLTGHTINDQAETFLLNLIRGSGLDGLSAMPITRPMETGTAKQPEITPIKKETETPQSEISDSKSQIQLIRPLLRWAKRSDTEDFCRDNKIDFRRDSMNDDLAFKRVKIRKTLLPLLEDMNPNIVETLANTSGLMQHVSWLQRSADNKSTTADLDIKIVKELSKPDLYRTLRGWLSFHRGSSRQLGLKHIQAIERLIFSKKSGRLIELPGDERVHRSDGKLTFAKNKVEN